MTDTVTLSGAGLTPATVDRIADGAPVAIAAEADDAMARGRAIVERYLAGHIPAYGLNTGLGVRATETLPADELAAFSYHLVRGRAQGLGDPLKPRQVRAVIAARLNTLLTGAAGVSPHVAHHLAAVLNAGLVPVMPRHASIGAGDLVAMAAIPHALIGDGEMLVDGARRPADEVLAATGIEPLALGPKDGLALSNITSFSVGLASLAAARARRALDALFAAAALSLEGFRGNLWPFEPGATTVRPQPGEVEAATHLRRLLDGSALNQPGAARRLQDPLSFRCLAQSLGAALAALDQLDGALAVELNGAADNPVVLIAEDRIVSTGNFHTPWLSLCLDGLARALAWTANDAMSRVHRLINPQLSGLPPLLSSGEPGRAGFGPLLKPAEALRAEIIQLANPVPILPSHNADGVEDTATFTAQAAFKLDDMLDRFELLIAFELLAAAQAVDLAAPAHIAPALAAVHRQVRDISAFLAADRPVGRDIEAIARDLVAGARLNPT